ncbi:MAG TPA: MATE family efflux transporter [Pyrinomonadaceae bacterium]|nr:MATE family efflux transporter [Pyrinomonadaceae bacterium]
MPDSTETTESFPPLPSSENVAESGLIANAELAAGLEAEPAAGAESAEGMWAAIRESLRGSHRDYTVGPIGRAVILLAIPMVLEMFMESLFAVADIFWVSHLGPEAAATVGLTESLLTLVYALAIGLSIGATATIARRIGERNPEGAARAAVQAILLALTVAIVIALIGAPLAPKLLSFMGAAPSVIAQGKSFTRIMMAGNVTVVMLFMINAVFRGAGDAAIAMRVLWLANSINIILGPLLIFGIGPFPKLGVAGAAIATNIGRGTGAVFALTRLVRPGGRFDIHRRHLRLEPAIMTRLLRLSSTATFQVFIGMASWIGLARIIASFGTEVVAGYIIGIRVVVFALLPSWGMSNAAATMVGQALGARNPDRAERAVWKAGFYNFMFLGVIGLVFVVFAGPIIRMFTSNPHVVPYGIDSLRIISYGFLFYAYGMVLGQSFNGAGDTWTPTIINLFVFWLWELPLAYVLAITFGMGPRGVFIAITIAFSTLAVVSGLVFRRGRWKTRVV